MRYRHSSIGVDSSEAAAGRKAGAGKRGRMAGRIAPRDRSPEERRGRRERGHQGKRTWERIGTGRIGTGQTGGWLGIGQTGRRLGIGLEEKKEIIHFHCLFNISVC